MSYIQDKKIFITGGLGFIGSHLVKRVLEEEPKEVVVYDVLAKEKHHRLLDINCAQVKIIHGNILDYDLLLKQIKNSDIVFHCAADTNMRSIGKSKEQDLSNGLIGTINLLEAMKENNIKKLIYLSSSAVYGELASSPVRENHGPLLPISTYGAAKLGAEGWVSSYSHLYEISSLIFRLGNVVGDKMDHGIIFDLINRLLKNKEELKILGNGKQGRTYIHTRTCVDRMIRVIDKLKFTHQCEVLNLSGNGVLTTLDVLDVIKTELEINDLKIIHENSGRGWKGDVSVVNLDCGKLLKLDINIPSSKDELVQAVRDLHKEVEDYANF